MLNHRQDVATTTPEFDTPRVASIRAAEAARHCVKVSCTVDGMDECRSSSEDTATVLEALVEMLERPYEPSRAASLRRMIEAGLAAAVECAGECNGFADLQPASAACVAACDDVAVSLRRLLREFAPADAVGRTGAI